VTGARHHRHRAGIRKPSQFLIAAIASYSITSSALTSSAGDVIRHRRRSFFPRVLVERAQHGERHGLNPGFDGRLRHRREQGRVVGRQLRTFALAGGSDALRLAYGLEKGRHLLLLRLLRTGGLLESVSATIDR
jgi:hypothetical protein